MPTWTQVRTVTAPLLWGFSAFAAFFLALGAVLIALQANEDSGLVQMVLSVANVLDIGIFDRMHGLKQWTSENAITKNALFNWGLGALFWLLVGRLADRFLRPITTSK